LVSEVILLFLTYSRKSYLNSSKIQELPISDFPDGCSTACSRLYALALKIAVSCLSTSWGLNLWAHMQASGVWTSELAFKPTGSCSGNPHFRTDNLVSFVLFTRHANQTLMAARVLAGVACDWMEGEGMGRKGVVWVEDWVSCLTQLAVVASHTLEQCSRWSFPPSRGR